MRIDRAVGVSLMVMAVGSVLPSATVESPDPLADLRAQRADLIAHLRVDDALVGDADQACLADLARLDAMIEVLEG